MSVTSQGNTVILGILALSLAAVVACSSAAPESPPVSEPQPQVQTQSQPQSQPEPAVASAGGAAPESDPAAQSTAPTVAPAAIAATSAPAPTTVPVMASEAEGTLSIAYTELGPPRFLPKLNGSPQASINMTTVYESPWHNDPKGNIMPRLFKSWSVSDNGLVWTFQIQEGIQFHEGKGEMTAKDIDWSVNNRLQEDSISRPTGLAAVWQAPEGGTTVIDDFTLEVDTSGSGPRFDISWYITSGKLGGQLVTSKKHVDALGEGTAGVEQPIGTGPWQSIEHRVAEFWHLEAVKDHWRKTPNFAELYIREISEESTRVANFLAGELDSMHMSLESISEIEKMDGVKIKRLEAGGQMFINIHGQMYVDRPDLPTPRNSDLPWISADPDTSSAEWEKARKVREAMAISIDRQLIVDTLLNGEGSPSSLFAWMGHENRLGPLYEELQYQYDPERAKQLLADAGYEDGFEINMALTTRPLPAVTEQGEVVCLMWEDVGISCIQERSQMSAFRPHFIDRSWTGVNTHGTDASPEPLTNINGQMSAASTVNYGIEHPWLEEKKVEALATVDEDQRFKVEAEIAKWIFDNVVILPTFKVNRVYPLGPRIDDWEMACCRTRTLLDIEYIPHRR